MGSCFYSGYYVIFDDLLRKRHVRSEDDNEMSLKISQAGNLNNQRQEPWFLSAVSKC